MKSWLTQIDARGIFLGTLLTACGLGLTSGCNSEQAGAAAHAQQEQELQQLRDSNQELQRLRSENQELPRLRRDNEELKRLRGQSDEVARLRQENEQLRAQLQMLKPAPRPRP